VFDPGPTLKPFKKGTVPLTDAQVRHMAACLDKFHDYGAESHRFAGTQHFTLLRRWIFQLGDLDESGRLPVPAAQDLGGE